MHATWCAFHREIENEERKRGHGKNGAKADSIDEQ